MKYQLRPEKTFKSGPFGKTRSLLTTVFAIVFVTMASFSFGQAPEVRAALRLIDIEQPTKGIAELERLAPSSSQNQYYLGLGYLRSGNKDNNWNKDKALAAFEKGISMNEKDGLNYAGKGQVKKTLPRQRPTSIRHWRLANRKMLMYSELSEKVIW
jgi:hypothetical protein